MFSPAFFLIAEASACFEARLFCGIQFEDFGHYQIEGGIGVEAVAAGEVGVMSVMLKIFLLAIHGGVFGAEKGEYFLGIVGSLALYAEFGLKLLRLQFLVFFHKLFRYFEILEAILAGIVEREPRACILTKLTAGMKRGIYENAAESTEQLGETSAHRCADNHCVGVEHGGQTLQFAQRHLGLHRQVGSDDFMLRQCTAQPLACCRLSRR